MALPLLVIPTCRYSRGVELPDMALCTEATSYLRMASPVQLRQHIGGTSWTLGMAGASRRPKI